jgi:hypothetical protein
MLRAVMNLKRQKRQVREQRLAAIPESDCEQESDSEQLLI